MRHTKIVATIGPATSEPQVLEALISAGVDVFRLNFSHGTHDTHAETYRLIREAMARAGRHASVLQDLSGPKIRTGPLVDGAPLVLASGDELQLAAGDETGGPGRVYTPYRELVRSARPGDRLLLDDGRIELRVVEARGGELTTVVVNGGVLGSHKGINAPGVVLPASALTEKDVADLRFGLELGVDLIALSFVQTAEDVEQGRAAMQQAGRVVPLIAKIERPAAVHNLEAILRAVDGVMVARGDLGLEMPLEQLPRVQKEIVTKARQLGRAVIVATQVLESMRTEPRPTRAEVSDAATAVDQGADAIMLAGETAVGAYPVEAVQTLGLVIREAERTPAGLQVHPQVDPTRSRHGRALCEAAVTLATTGQADAIIAVTREGKTARLLSALRPAIPIYAATPSAAIADRLALLWGVTPFVTGERDPAGLQDVLIQRHLLAAGATVVFISVGPELNRPDVNFLNLQKLQPGNAP